MVRIPLLKNMGDLPLATKLSKLTSLLTDHSKIISFIFTLWELFMEQSGVNSEQNAMGEYRTVERKQSKDML